MGAQQQKNRYLEDTPKNQEAQILKECFLFQHLPCLPADLPPAERFARGERIYEENHFPDSLGILLSGTAEADSIAKESVTLTVFRAGSIFGAAALFRSDEDPASYISVIRATSECRVLLLPETLLLAWFREYPVMAENYIRFLTGRIRYLNRKLAVYTDDTVDGRVYRYLMNACDASGKLPASLTMTKLADNLSIGRTSLYRAVKVLEEKGKISHHGGKIEVKVS